MPKDRVPDGMQPERKIPCGCIALILFIGIPFGFILLALLLILGRDSAANGRVRDQIAALKSSGKPVDDATLKPYYEESTTDDDLQRWLEIISIIDNKSFYAEGKDLGPWSGFSRIPVDGEWGKETESREFRAKYASTIDELKRLAMARKRVRFPIEFNSFNTLLSSVQSCRSLQRVLAFETQIDIRDRDSKKIREDLSAMLGLGIAVEGSPFLVSSLVADVLNRVAIAELQVAIELDVLGKEELLQLLLEIQSGSSLAREWKQAIATERAAGLVIFTNTKVSQAEGIPSIPFRSNDALNYLQAMSEFEEAPTEDLNRFLAATDSVFESMEKKIRSTMMLDGIVTSKIFPAMRQVALAMAEKEMRIRMAELAIGIRLYKIKHGSFPVELDALTDIGMDSSKLVPVGSKPFGYRIKDGRAILWGFSLRSGKETPDQPPEVAPSTVDFTGEARNVWKWELR